jgi:hypothetical protein
MGGGLATGVAAGIEIDAYAGYKLHSVEVTIDDPTPIRLIDGLPA